MENVNSFETTERALAYIRENANTGEEHTIGDAIMFGMGIYAYADVARKAGLDTAPRCEADKGNTAFVHLYTDEEILALLEFLQEEEGLYAV